MSERPKARPPYRDVRARLSSPQRSEQATESTAPTEPLKTTSEEIVAEQERLELWVCLGCRQTWLDDTSLIPSGGGYGHSLGFDLCGEVVEVNAARDDAAELRALLNHPLLNKLMGELEDHSTGRWWGMAEEWMDLRDAALAATEGSE